MGQTPPAQAPGKHLLGRADQPGAPSHWFIYIEVGDIGAYTDKTKKLGATIHMDNQPVPDMGFFSIIEDPTGAVFGIWEPHKK